MTKDRQLPWYRCVKQARGAPSTRWVSLVNACAFMLLLLAALGLAQVSYAANPPQPTYDIASVDGQTNEWDLTNDFFADMYRGFDPEKKVESKLYLRYDCASQTVYALVLTVPGVTGVVSPDDAWLAIDDISNKVVNGSSVDDGIPPDFQWVGLSGNTAQGYEASFTLAPGSYTLLAHINVTDEGTQTSATARGGIELLSVCPEPCKIDMLIKKGTLSDSYYQIDNTYQTTPAGGQIVTLCAAPGGSCAQYSVKVENENTTQKTVVLKVISQSLPSGWTATYKIGDTTITMPYLVTIPANGSVVVKITLCADCTVTRDSLANVVLGAFQSEASTTPCDAVKAVAKACGADLLIKKESEDDTAFASANVYQVTPSGNQIESQTVAINTAAVYKIKVINRLCEAATFCIKVTENMPAGWQWVIKDPNGTPITLVNGSFTTPTIPSSQFVIFTLEVTPNAESAAGTTKDITFTAFSTCDCPYVLDSVKASTTAEGEEPCGIDLLIKKTCLDESYFRIDNTYQTTPSGEQIVTQCAAPGGPCAEYCVKIENEGTAERTVILKEISRSLPTGWTATYKVGATTITLPYSATIAAKSYLIVKVILCASCTVERDSAANVVVGAFPDESATTPCDAVKAIATACGADLLIKKGSEADEAFATPDVYQDTPTGDQIECQTVALNTAACYKIKVHNRLCVPATFCIKVCEDTLAGWQWVLKDPTGAIVTLNNGAFTTPSIPGNGSLIYTLEVTPIQSSAANTTKNVIIKVFSTCDCTYVLDCVQVCTTAECPAPCSIDLLIKKCCLSDNTYQIDNTYQTTPSGRQIVTQCAIPGGPCMEYCVKIENESNQATTVLLKATQQSVPTGWTLTYKLDGQPITLPCTLSIPANSCRIIVVCFCADCSVNRNGGAYVTLGAFVPVESTTPCDTVRAVVKVCGADLLIKKSGEGAECFASDNVYQTTPSGDQIECQTVPLNTPACYNIKVENDTVVARAYCVKVIQNYLACWQWTLKDNNGMPVTLTNGMFTTPVIQPNSSVIYTLEVTPTHSSAIGTTNVVIFEVYADCDTACACLLDTVQASTTACDTTVANPVDLLIKKACAPDSAYAVADVYQTTPCDGQVVTQCAIPGCTCAEFLVKVKNNTAEERTVTLKTIETMIPNGWTVTYLLDSTCISLPYNVTLPANGCVIVKIRLCADCTAWRDSVAYTVLGAFANAQNTTPYDAVKAVAKICGADLLIKKGSESDSCYAINDVYQCEPSGNQVECQQVPPHTPACFNILVQNDTCTPRSYRLKLTSNEPSGWQVVLKDCNGNTFAFTNGTLTTPVIQPGCALLYTLELTAVDIAAANTTKCVTIKAYANCCDSACQYPLDAVKACATVYEDQTYDTYQPDLQARYPENTTSCVGENIYNTTGTNQSLSSTISQCTTVRYEVRLVNDGTASDCFKVQGTGSDSNWTVRYYSCGTEITSDITGAGWIGTLSPGGAVIFTAELTPLSTSAGTKCLLIKATSKNDINKVDVVKLTATVNCPTPPTGTYQPELMIKGANGSILGDNIYNTTGTNQTSYLLATSTAGAAYAVCIQNDGTQSDSFKITGTAGNSSWRVQYYCGSTDITGLVTGSGWIVDLSSAAYRAFTIVVTPCPGLASNSTFTVTVQAQSKGDMSKYDVVKAATKVQ